jgi:hypothetical protein
MTDLDRQIDMTKAVDIIRKIDVRMGTGWAESLADTLNANWRTDVDKQDAAEQLLKVLQDVRKKRLRQINQHGWTREHDNEHRLGEIACAAISYIQAAYKIEMGLTFEELTVFWPWKTSDDWKPNLAQDRRELLVNAAALLIADIERLDRR